MMYITFVALIWIAGFTSLLVEEAYDNAMVELEEAFADHQQAMYDIEQAVANGTADSWDSIGFVSLV
jgi:hypothetical protein